MIIEKINIQMKKLSNIYLKNINNNCKFNVNNNMFSYFIKHYMKWKI